MAWPKKNSISGREKKRIKITVASQRTDDGSVHVSFGGSEQWENCLSAKEKEKKQTHDSLSQSVRSKQKEERIFRRHKRNSHISERRVARLLGKINFYATM